MLNIATLEDIHLLRETVSLECKLASGRDGKGAIPDDFWKTYSSFANTFGGVIILGLRERDGTFSPVGLKDIGKVRRELFNELTNRHKVSFNLLSDDHIIESDIEGCKLLVINVPRANRKQRPVYLTKNPFGNTYRRLNDGDRVVSDDDVKRMLAEQVEDSLDSSILTGYSFDDLCIETFRAYRQLFQNREPEHPWNTLDDHEFLNKIGGWKKDRETGQSGLTLAGLLMFGWMSSIQEVLPNYMLDYQERPEPKAELRWVDRVTLDGKWSGNLFDFYRRVYLKLTADLKIPFMLEKGERVDETAVHVAIREALANTLVHSDYSERASVLIVKRPDLFGFRNPGLMRVPPEIAIQGGEHDCRNRILHKMFRLVGIGEQAGSGIPKIFNGWASQHWRPPTLYEKFEPYSQTLMELRMVDLLPQEVLADLKSRFGDKFELLDRNDRLVLAIVATESTATHSRVREFTGMTSLDTSRILQHLVRQELLETHNAGRGAVYCLPGADFPIPEEVFGITYISQASPSVFTDFSTDVIRSSPNLGAKLGKHDDSSPNLGAKSDNYDDRSPNLGVKSDKKAADSINLRTKSPSDEKLQNVVDKRDVDGCLLTSMLSLPVIDDLGQLTLSLLSRLEDLADLPRAKRKIDKEAMIDVILTLCTGRYVTLRCLSELVDRKPETLREQYLTNLVKDKRLSMAFPTTPTHERQAYCTTESL
jgi:ATP-dependent DNA helicase RecG